MLRRALGYPSFRPGQEELVRAVLEGRDALGVLPTGGGKSVCYQVPALMLGGLTLVVTPLISLMEDQVGRARAAGLRAAHLSQSQSSDVRRRVQREALAGSLDLLFVSPERLAGEGFQDLVARAGLRLLAIDEAHCISEWGHDFRPSYRRIGLLRRKVTAPALALTASATPEVRQDIAHSLGLFEPLVVVRSFDRPNLWWAVRPGRSMRARMLQAHRVIRRVSGPVIVYAGTRRLVEIARDTLARRGIRAAGYHAGMSPSARSSVQEQFMAGATRVVVATNAFGMGIDKSDVRCVVHLQMPATLESYYQEAGRGGRDGEPSSCIAFHSPRDRVLADGFIDRIHPSAAVLRRLHRTLRRAADADGVAPVDSRDVSRILGAKPTAWMEGEPDGPLAALERVRGVRRRAIGTDGTSAVSLSREVVVMGRPDFGEATAARRRARAKLHAVQRFARTRLCRRNALLRYFGETVLDPCGRCDRCGWDLGSGFAVP